MLVAEVIVDLDVWSLDRPLSYLVPDSLVERARVGSVVRVPLRGRRIRGWIVAIGEVAPGSWKDGSGDLAEIASVSGRGPVFDEPLLAMARTMARRYVHPLRSFLSLFTPARLGRPRVSSARVEDARRESGKRLVWHIGPSTDPLQRYTEEIGRVLVSGRSAIVCVPEVHEGSKVLDALKASFSSDAAIVHSGVDPADRAAALWDASEGRKRLILGGRAAIFSPMADAGLIIVHSEHDRSLKEQRAPYYSAVEAAIQRAAVSGGDLWLVSKTPSLATLSRAAAEGWMVELPPRAELREAWPFVELLEPIRAPIPRRAVAAIMEARRRGERTIVLLPRTETTASGPGPRRIVEYLSRVVPGARISRADRPALDRSGTLKDALSGEIVVATEAGLAEIERPPVSTAIALGLDSFLKRPLGRSVEDAFETLWNLGCLVSGRKPKGRLLLETAMTDHHSVQALTRGDHRFFAERELVVRRNEEAPPFTSLIKLNISGNCSDETMKTLEQLPGVAVLGPIEGRMGSEVMLRAKELEAIVDPLREIVSGAAERILVEVDPREW